VRGKIKQRSKGSWTIILDLPRGEDGRRKQQWLTIHGTKRSAERKLAELLSNLDQGVLPDTGKLKLKEYLESWLVAMANYRQPRTVEGYATIVRKYLVPHLGNGFLSKLAPSSVEKMYFALLESGLSPNTVHHVHVCLSKALGDAVRKGLVGRNICKLVDAPSPGRYEVNIPEIEGVRRILTLASETPYYAVFHFIAYTGVRRAEAAALTWNDLDLDRGIASITKSLQRLQNKGLVVTTTKSAASRRGIALDNPTVAVLKAHRVEQLLYKKQTGDGWNYGDLVFPNEEGNHLDPATLTRNFEKLARKAGYPGLRLHDLRHCHAAGLIKAGASPKIVQERLGHASAAFTLQVYGHVSSGMQATAANAFANLMAESG